MKHLDKIVSHRFVLDHWKIVNSQEMSNDVYGKFCISPSFTPKGSNNL